MMRTSYDPEADAMFVWFGPEGVKSAETEEVAPGIMLDFDDEGEVIGVEILYVSQRMARPKAAACFVRSASVSDGIETVHPIEASGGGAECAPAFPPCACCYAEAGGHPPGARPRQKKVDEGMVGFVNVKTDYRARATTVRFSSRET